MIREIAERSLTQEFNAFLFAQIGRNGNGMQVSVLSGLAQSELDPWVEAAELAQLPGKTAIDRLAVLIGKMPNKGWAYPDAITVSTRLIALLPKRLAGSHEQPGWTFSGVMNSKPWWFYVALMSFILVSQFILASHQSPPRADTAAVNVSRNGPSAPTVKINQ